MIFPSATVAEQYFEYWISEHPEVRFYNIFGERLIAIDHGDMTFHLERTGTFFDGFEGIIRGESQRCGIDVQETGFSVEYALYILCEREKALQRKRGGFWRRFVPSGWSRFFGGGRSDL